MAWTPNDGLPGQKSYCASFVRAFRTERMQLISRLQNQHPLPAYRNDDELVLLEFGRFIARQMRWAGRTCLRQRFKVTNDRISNTDQPTEEACAQKNVHTGSAGGCKTGNYQVSDSQQADSITFEGNGAPEEY